MEVAPFKIFSHGLKQGGDGGSYFVIFIVNTCISIVFFHQILIFSSGIAVVQVNATDLDFDGKTSLEFAIAEGNEGGRFSIDARTGLITVAKPEGFAAQHRLKVTPSDGQLSSSCALCAVNINVLELPNSDLSFAVDFAGVEENSTWIDTVASRDGARAGQRTQRPPPVPHPQPDGHVRDRRHLRRYTNQGDSIR